MLNREEFFNRSCNDVVKKASIKLLPEGVTDNHVYGASGYYILWTGRGLKNLYSKGSIDLNPSKQNLMTENTLLRVR